jgi:phosphoglycolate phosphatase-like HAD superfamily hydrolase
VLGNSQKEEPYETLHNYSIDYIKAIAQVFGWRVRASKGSQKGPDLIIEECGRGAEGKEKIEAVMFVESEVGHYESEGVEKYYDKLSKRLRPYIDEYKARGVEGFSLVIITNAPRKHANYVKEHEQELSEKMGFQVVEGLTLFVVPALLVKEVMPTIFVRAAGAPPILV